MTIPVSMVDLFCLGGLIIIGVVYLLMWMVFYDLF